MHLIHGSAFALAFCKRLIQLASCPHFPVCVWLIRTHRYRGILNVCKFCWNHCEVPFSIAMPTAVLYRMVSTWTLVMGFLMPPMCLSHATLPMASLFSTTQTCRTTLICKRLLGRSAPSKGPSMRTGWRHAGRHPLALLNAVWI